MPHEENEVYRRRLIEAVRIERPGERSEALREIREAVGGSFCGKEVSSRKERDSETIAAIHQALQTASMIDACRTAADNAKLTREALQETRRAQRTNKMLVGLTTITALAAAASAGAAWYAVFRT